MRVFGIDRMKYQPALDGLRGLAVMSVMGFHFSRDIFSGGSLGVDIFFVLSGYLITSILVNEIENSGKVDYSAFLLRRARRLFPALIALLIFYATTAPYLFPQVAERSWLDVTTAILYVTNLRQTFWPANTPLSHTWSLAIEEQFYVIWPFALAWLARLDRRSTAQLLVAIWVALTLARWLWSETIGGPGAYYFTPLHSTGLLLGSALALHPVKTELGKVALVFLIALLLAGQTSSTMLISVPLAEVLTAVVIANPIAALAKQPMCFLGRISYGVYLWHIPLLWLLKPASLAEAGIYFAASIAAGWLSFVLVERWFLVRKQEPERALAPT